MKKILVTTDFSTSSRAAIYFAIQLASQIECSLTFFHSFHLMTPTAWNEKVLESFDKSETHKIEVKLQRMVEYIYKRMGLKRGDYNFMISKSLSPEKDILEYASSNDFDFICISRRGHSAHKNIFGTVTAGLINKSSIPIIAVTPGYKAKEISKLLYVSDMVNLINEVKCVVDFAKPLKVDLELLHFKVPSDVDQQELDEASKEFSGSQIKVQMRDFNFLESLAKNIDKEIRSLKPSMVIMFTQQHRGFFARLILPGVTSSYAFKASVPLLIFPKTDGSKALNSVG